MVVGEESASAPAPASIYVTLRYVTLRYVTLRYVTLRYVTLRTNDERVPASPSKFFFKCSYNFLDGRRRRLAVAAINFTHARTHVRVINCRKGKTCTDTSRRPRHSGIGIGVYPPRPNINRVRCCGFKILFCNCAFFFFFFSSQLPKKCGAT